jgi:hypothetical protein
MTSLQPDQWHDLFADVAGASAALTGLIYGALAAAAKLQALRASHFLVHRS